MGIHVGADGIPSVTPNRNFTLCGGVKRNRTPIVCRSPLFGDLPIPVSHPTLKRTFTHSGQPPVHYVDDDAQSPAPKMIKRENVSFRRNIKLELDVEESPSNSEGSDSRGGSSHSSPSTSSSQGGNHSNGKNGQQQQHQHNGINNYGNVNYQNGRRDATPSNVFPKQMSTERPFCYNCKQYGHIRQECNFAWYHWWPNEYLFRHPWLRRKIYEAGQLRRNRRMMEYRRMVRKMEDDVEEQDRRKRDMFLRSESRNEPRYYSGGLSTAKSRADGQRILQAIRRNSPAPNSPQLPCCPQQYQFTFNCQQLVEDLQRQVAQLQIALTRQRSATPCSPARGSERRRISKSRLI